MSYTGQNYVDGIRKTLKDPRKQTWSDDELLEYVNDSREDLWKRAKWNFRKGIDSTLGTTSSQADYTIPSTISVIHGIYVVLNGNKNNLLPIQYQDYISRTSGTARVGTPEVFYRSGNKIYLDPIPDQTVLSNIFIHGYLKPSRIGLTDTDTIFPDDFYLAIKLHSVASAWDADEDNNNASSYYRRYVDQIKTLKKEFVAEQSGYPVNPMINNFINETDPKRLGTIT